MTTKTTHNKSRTNLYLKNITLLVNMISRRDKLLIRPWEQRRYEYHRRQVQSALPAIDVGPPKNRLHVSYKQKKHQKEIERCNKIEKDNLKLLQRLRSCMSTSRVDNFWATSQPNFLNKVKIYKTDNNKNLNKPDDVQISNVYENTRRGRCIACTPKKTEKPKIPEERIPWDPPKPAVGRQRSQSLPPHKFKDIEKNLPKEKSKSRQNSLIRNDQSNKITPQKPKIKQRSSSSKSLVPLKKKSAKIEDEMEKSFKERSIILSRDDIKLAVSFPSDTLIKLKDGYREKVLIDESCHCKAIKS